MPPIKDTIKKTAINFGKKVVKTALTPAKAEALAEMTVKFLDNKKTYVKDGKVCFSKEELAEEYKEMVKAVRKI